MKTLLLYTCLALFLSLFLSFIRFPSLVFHGLFTYIHPDNANANANRLRPAISTSASTSNIRKTTKSNKGKSELDAQIFRLKLDADHLQTRIFYADYHTVSVLSFVTLSTLLLHLYFHKSQSPDADASLIPVLLAFLSLSRLLFALAKLFFHKSASASASHKTLSFSLALLAFLFALLLPSSTTLRSLLDFHFLRSLRGFWAFLFAAFMGCLAGLLYMPAFKSARAFWLGTDQIRCNLDLISCGCFARSTLYLPCILNIFTALLWITPFMEIFINDKSEGRLVGNVGMSSSDFAKFRLSCLLLSGISQMIALRPNLQMYLNEAVLSWYQRLHASRIPDLDYSRAKVFLHNHYACLTILHMFIPPAMVLVFLGLSQIEGRPFGKLESLCSEQQPCFGFIKEAALLLAWWVVLVWSFFTTVTLVWYRRGFIYVS